MSITEVPTSASASDRIKSIQLLRGLAAVTVVVAHAGAHPLSEAPVWGWVAGRLGVTLFFVISGFIMVVVAGQCTFDSIRFLRARVVRIVPIYWSITIFTALVSIAIPAVFQKTIFSLSHLMGSLFFIPMLRPGNPGMIEPFLKRGWTLNYEMFFYICFASLYFLEGAKRVVVLIAIFSLLVCIGQLFEPQQTILKFYTTYDLIGFAAGTGLGLAYQQKRLHGIGFGRGMFFLLIAVVMAISIFGWSETKYPRLDRQLAFVACSLFAIAGGLAIERAGRLVNNQFISSLGNASYSIYLMHMFPIGAIALLSRNIFGVSMSLTQYLLVLSLGAAAGLWLGILIYRFIEKPLLDLVHRYVPYESKPKVKACQ